MRKWTLAALAALAAAGSAVAHGTVVGEPLCGPVCAPEGPTHWQRSCLGVVRRTLVPDMYWDRCHGVPYGPRRCYGRRANDGSPGALVVRIPCREG